VELRGDTAPPYQFAPADVAYPSTINHLLVLYVLNRSTGIPLWQHILVYPDQQQHAVILGADNNYIYVSSTQTHPAPESKGTTLQLFAVNRTTGTIDWRVFGPTEPKRGPHDDGQLFLKEGQAIWQVAGTIYAIDTVVGQIEWRRQIADDDLSVLVQEDQMTEVAGALLIMRRHGVHGLDPNTGNELWTLPAKGASTPHSLAGVAVVGQTILAYGNGQIEAFDVIDRHSLWRHIEFNAIQHLSISDDKKTIYLIEVSDLAGSAPTLVALNVQTGTTQWRFEPARQATFSFTSPDSFLSGNSLLFVTVCFPFGQDSCAHQRLYALATETGEPVWTFAGYRFSDLHLSQDGKTLLFSVNTNVWVQIWWSV
jgi:outer membrane protein assembly factor BamB